MTSSELERIRSRDVRCGDNELTFFPVTIHRRRLLQYVDELRAEVALLSALQIKQERTRDAAVCRGPRSPIVAGADAKTEDTAKRALQAGAQDHLLEGHRESINASGHPMDAFSSYFRADV